MITIIKIINSRLCGFIYINTLKYKNIYDRESNIKKYYKYQLPQESHLKDDCKRYADHPSGNRSE